VKPRVASGSDEARRPRHRSESKGSSRHLNLLNRPVRTRMPGGVGGEGPQGSPLSRSATSNVKLLVLTHISGRYSDEEILAEAAKTFPNSRVAADFDHIAV
jgi:hypothetical protein